MTIEAMNGTRRPPRIYRYQIFTLQEYKQLVILVEYRAACKSRVVGSGVSLKRKSAPYGTF